MISTDRLTLRPHTLDDLPALTAMWSDAEVVRFLGGNPSTAEESWARLLRYAGHWAMNGFGWWAVIAHEEDTYLGEMGFMDFKRTMIPAFGEAPEMGWAFNRAAQGQGYALEAGQAALAWAKTRFGGARAVCMIAPDNAPSLKLAGKLGFSEFARTAYKNEPMLLLERLLSSQN